MSTILFIDDDAEYGAMLDTLLGMHGFTVEVAKDGLEGLKKARELQPDLIILDLFLPPIGGLGVVHQLKERTLTGEIPVVVMSALPIDRSRKIMNGAGVQGFISKPFQIEDLVGAIHKNLPADPNADSFDRYKLTA